MHATEESTIGYQGNEKELLRAEDVYTVGER